MLEAPSRLHVAARSARGDWEPSWERDILCYESFDMCMDWTAALGCMLYFTKYSGMVIGR